MAYLVHFGRRGEEDNVLDGREYPMTDIEHSGTKEHSGRYKWGSGNRPFQRLENKLNKKNQKRKEKFEKYLKREEAKASYKETRKNRRILTDEEVRTVINRMKMESEMKDLLDQNINPAKSNVKKALEKAGQQAIERAGRDVMQKTLYWLVASTVNSATNKSHNNMPSLSEYLMGRNEHKTPASSSVESSKKIKNKLDKTFNKLGIESSTRESLLTAIDEALGVK